MEDFLTGLNPQQRQAVEYIDGPSLIIAGAGSGKTRVLTYKIAYLLANGYPSHSILALTFTNKAAKEMKERIAELIGWSKARGLWMGTFHSVFSRILRSDAEHLGFTSNFTIMDSSDSKNLVKSIIKEFLLDDKVYKPSKILSIISSAKNNLISYTAYGLDKELIEHDTKSKIPLTKDIYKAYCERLKRSNAMDFDDLLYYTNILFRDNPEVLKKYQDIFNFVLVDEYQDTNFSQYLVVKQLTALSNKVCVVGDDAQSIYSFRGANISNILNFQETYTNAKLFKLEQNYRSTQVIVDAANSVIKQNKEQIPKNVFSEKEIGEKICVESAYSDYEEAAIVANKIFELRSSKSYTYSDFAILYRTNAQSRTFEEALRKKNVPYRIYGGLSFYQRKEIKDIISYFRLIINPNDEEAFKRVVNYPTRGIGATTISKIAIASNSYDVSFWETIAGILNYNLSISAATAKKLLGFKNLIDSFIDVVSELNAYELARMVVTDSGIAKEAYLDKTPEGVSRQENIQELLSGIHEFCESKQEEGESCQLWDFLAEVALLTDQDKEAEKDIPKISMMTIHASKGLEFKNVFIVGLEEDLFPSMMVKYDFKGLEEERRLFYVAITRAEDFCMISYAKSRFKNGSMNFSSPSRFLSDIDFKYLRINGQDSQIQLKSSDKVVSPISRVPTTNLKKVSSINTGSPTVNKHISQGKMKIDVGNTIEHERFGIGKVIAIQGEAENAQAVVNFENSGEKKLLLRFAKFFIID